MKKLVFISVLASLVLLACGPGGVTTEEPPAAPTDVTTTSGPGYVQVDWQDQSTTETGFLIYRESSDSSLSGAQTPSKVGEVGSNVEEYVDGSVEPGDSYSYSVVAKGAGGASEPAASTTAATIPVGIGAMVGAVNNPFTPFTGLTVLLSIPASDMASGFSLEIAGPAGWNFDAVYQETYTEPRPTDWLLLLFLVDPVPGDYDVTVSANGTDHQDTATLPEDPKLYPLPTDVTVTAASASSVSATWEADDVFKSYSPGVLEDDGYNIIAGYESTLAKQHTLSGLSLAADQYVVTVPAYPIDISNQPVMIEDYGYAFAFSEPFVISAAGEACFDGNPLVDDALSQAVVDALGLDREPKCADLTELTVLEANERGVEDLTGLQYALGLQSLQNDNNDVDDLSPLSGLSEFRALWTGGNPISDLEPIRDLQITGLSLWNTNVEPDHLVDVVSGYSEITHLFLWGGAPADMDWVTALTELVELWYGGSGVTALPDLSSLTGLYRLGLDGNDLSTVADLEDLAVVFEGRTPPDGATFELDISDNRFDLGTTAVQDAIADIEDLGVSVLYTPQREP